MNKINKNLIVKISIPVIIGGMCFGAYKALNVNARDVSTLPVIVNEDSSSLPSVDVKPLEILSKKVLSVDEFISKNYGFTGENEVLLGIGMKPVDFYKKYTKNSSDMNDKEMNNARDDQLGNIYKLNLSTLEKTPLNINVKSLISDLSPNGEKINYEDNNKYNIYNLKNNSKIPYDNKSKKESPNGDGAWSEDGNCFISFFNDGDLKVYNQKNNTTKELKIKRDDLWISSIADFYSEDGNDIYFMGDQPKGKTGSMDFNIQRQGIFKVNSNTNDIEKVFVLPYSDHTSKGKNKNSGLTGDFKVLDKGNKILFDGLISGEAGTYIYDVNSKKFYNVIPHTFKSKEGEYGIFSWISPDESKIVYGAPDYEDNKKTHWNLYAAKISGNTITGKICIAKDYFPHRLSWSNDSKKVVFFNEINEVKKNGFSIVEKSEVNVITFK
ncbi:hypothetical protein [Clostridium sp. JS66]|uniref:hypothetical protein n=1 Tax=Clostridium sp. JS66 TaxID=3064705 RepID=UPI00298DD600|nr:hypothetical protein [Clostridium sp. JS66]WPC44009.1 hypothetical protein Q6H37_11190 [Clostridium sp. JS66]